MSEFTGDFYDEDYFERGKESGKGWLENYRWLPRRTFKEAFAFIDTLKLDEKAKVLEIGCAKGFLVRALRELEIDTDGCDISQYALNFAPENCWNCSLDWKWEAYKDKYTHIIIKDVLEHMTPDELIINLRLYSKVGKKLMCVVPLGDKGTYRIPEYHLEISHIIAEDMLWWNKMFEKGGWKVVDFKYHVNGLKDNWFLINPIGNGVFILEYCL